MCLRLCVHVRMSVYVYVCMYVCMYVCVGGGVYVTYNKGLGSGFPDVYNSYDHYLNKKSIIYISIYIMQL